MLKLLIATNLGPPISLVSSVYSRTPKVLKGWIGALKQQLPSLDPKDLLPLGIEVRKGAIVIGNESTPTLLVVDFKSTEGTYGIVPVRQFIFSIHKMFVNLNPSPGHNVITTSRLSTSDFRKL